MPAYIALLRAVNVGGTKKLPMADFRKMLEELGYTRVETYIQSGNAVFDAKVPPAKVAKVIAAALEKLASLQPRNPTVYLSLGDVQFQEGEGEQAHRNWRRALELAGAGDKDLTNAINARLTGPVTADTFR